MAEFKPFPPMKRINMTEFEELFEDFTGRMRKIGLGVKLNDYSNPDHALCNFVSSSWRGIIMTCAQKFGRLINIAWGKEMKIKDESFVDNVVDIAFYMFLAFCCWRAEKAVSENVTEISEVVAAREGKAS